MHKQNPESKHVETSLHLGEIHAAQTITCSSPTPRIPDSLYADRACGVPAKATQKPFDLRTIALWSRSPQLLRPRRPRDIKVDE